MIKIAFIIAFKNFRDEEYFVPKQIFQENGFEVKTVSSQKGTAIGGDGAETQVDLTFDELDAQEFNALVFAGGPGAYSYIEDENLHKLIAKHEGLLAAICIAPAILAKAGVLRNKKATIWSSPMDRRTIRILEENEAQYTDKRVVRDGNVITANGPRAAEEFGRKIVEYFQ